MEHFTIVKEGSHYRIKNKRTGKLHKPHYKTQASAKNNCTVMEAFIQRRRANPGKKTQ